MTEKGCFRHDRHMEGEKDMSLLAALAPVIIAAVAVILHHLAEGSHHADEPETEGRRQASDR